MRYEYEPHDRVIMDRDSSFFRNFSINGEDDTVRVFEVDTNDDSLPYQVAFMDSNNDYQKFWVGRNEILSKYSPIRIGGE